MEGSLQLKRGYKAKPLGSLSGNHVFGYVGT